MNARELFESVKGAAPRIEELTRTIADLRSEGGYNFVTRSGGGSAHSSSGTGNPTAALALGHMQALEDAELELAALESALGECLGVIEGVRAHLGDEAADVLDLHYIDGNSLVDISFELGCSLATCYRIRSRAFAWLDEVGIAAAKGIGARALVKAGADEVRHC